MFDSDIEIFAERSCQSRSATADCSLRIQATSLWIPIITQTDKTWLNLTAIAAQPLRPFPQWSEVMVLAVGTSADNTMKQQRQVSNDLSALQMSRGKKKNTFYRDTRMSSDGSCQKLDYDTHIKHPKWSAVDEVANCSSTPACWKWSLIERQMLTFNVLCMINLIHAEQQYAAWKLLAIGSDSEVLTPDWFYWIHLIHF